MEKTNHVDLSHHKKREYCTNRLRYRDGRKLTAVKVYTVVNESKHLMVFGVPRINLYQEIKQLFAKHGKLTEVKRVTDELKANDTVQIEQFTDCYYVKYEKVHQARLAKARIDRKNFYGGILHVSYAPEYETVSDVREKLKYRKQDVLYRLKQNTREIANE
ncbi:RNA-binding protein 48 isoform X2 [Contarinia nasturtii]|uniref:RNA-binding protein 48 isoform X2 n=1 Tax=Contarinia nasturtii TaxID=265458 RepID=UPI0012D47381|nr:RNA-binding protein 48 isoform X2 [Contarinia nasturtii]XP_031630077.1 RNA-binding protein 48 isoform X2 [Contarinia nasturtii]XP_031630078.1 RNA-binding protein 48 isoform X2 [Contarinia nasturtii]